jgi:Protein of unknown function (DUF3306)
MSRPVDTEGSFLDRWSRRKQLVQRESIETPVIAPPEALQAEDDAGQLPLPSLDDIIPGSDVAAFFQKHVPDELRTAALRKLWITDPEIKGFIEMADYQWDFNNPDSIPGWSSTLEGYDIKSMVENVFGRPAQPATLSPQVTENDDDSAETPAGAALDAPSPAGSSLRRLGENADKSDTSIPVDVPLPEQLIQNGAVQKTQTESDVYEVARKRHGGALPS